MPDCMFLICLDDTNEQMTKKINYYKLSIIHYVEQQYGITKLGYILLMKLMLQLDYILPGSLTFQIPLIPLENKISNLSLSGTSRTTVTFILNRFLYKNTYDWRHDFT